MLVGGQQHFRIASGSDSGAFRFQPLGKLDVIINFTVVGNHEVASQHGLVPGGRRVEYAQAAVTENGVAVAACPQSRIIRPPVGQHPRHICDALLLNSAVSDQAGDATHDPG